MYPFCKSKARSDGLQALSNDVLRLQIYNPIQLCIRFLGTGPWSWGVYQFVLRLASSSASGVDISRFPQSRVIQISICDGREEDNANSQWLQSFHSILCDNYYCNAIILLLETEEIKDSVWQWQSNGNIEERCFILLWLLAPVQSRLLSIVWCSHKGIIKE